MKSKTSAALLLVAIFVLGGIAGGVAQNIYRDHIVAGPPLRSRVPNSHDITEEMAQSLNLDAGQKQQLESIIRQSSDRYRTLSRQFRPQYEKLRAETNEAIRALLRPEQLLRFDDTLENLDNRHRTHTHEPPPPNPAK